VQGIGWGLKARKAKVNAAVVVRPEVFENSGFQVLLTLPSGACRRNWKLWKMAGV